MGVTHSTYIMENKSFSIVKKQFEDKIFDTDKLIDNYSIDRDSSRYNKNRLWLDKSAGELLEIMWKNEGIQPIALKAIEGNEFTYGHYYIESQDIELIYQSLLKENYLDEEYFLTQYKNKVSYGDKYVDSLITQYLGSDRKNSLLTKARLVTSEWLKETTTGKWRDVKEEEKAYIDIDYCYSYLKDLYEFYEKNHNLKDVWFLIYFQ